jgi:hypothetical protein
MYTFDEIGQEVAVRAKATRLGNGSPDALIDLRPGPAETREEILLTVYQATAATALLCWNRIRRLPVSSSPKRIAT